MITVQSIDNLQTVAPETKILSLSTSRGSFAALQIDIPSEIKQYFESFLKKAHDHVGSDQCQIEIERDGSINVYLPIEAAEYTVSGKSLNGEITYHEVSRSDPYGGKRVSRVRDDRYWVGN